MKCTICGGLTLASAKLCMPCRAALRRARDDTISELLPLPRRREAFAFSHSPGIGRAPLAPLVRGAPEVGAGSRFRRLTSAQLHAAAVVAFVAAAGVLTFIMARELHRERALAVSTPPAPTVETRVAVPRVSPSAMLGNARDESSPSPASTPEHDTAELPASNPVALDRRVERPTKTKPLAAKTPVLIDPAPAGSTVEPPVIILAPVVAPTPTVRAAPDRAQVLAAALAKCGGDFFSRVGCEQRTRAQHCEGQWGQTPQCPAGIANDHGQ